MAAGRIDAVVFDFDGVILESANLKTEAFAALFAHLGDELVAAVRAHHLANVGISRFVKFAWIYEHLLHRELSAAESASLGERFSAICLEQILACPFVPGAEAALAALAGRPLFVASGTPQEELDGVVDRRGLRRHFREVWGAPREKPAILADLMARHDLRADRVLFVGDGMSDHKAARAAGVEFLARDTPELHEEWIRLGARRIADLTELPAVVERW